MATKGKTSEVGESSPTDESKKQVDDLVSDVLDSPSPPPKSTLPKEEEGLNEDTSNEESVETSTETEETEEVADTEDQDKTDDTTDEVIPASKHKKILEKMQKRIDSLVAEREAQRLKEQSAPKSQEDKLAALSPEELSELRDNVEESIIDAKVTAKTEGVDATQRVNELRQLKREIDKTVKLLPQRFQSKQLEHLNKMIDTVKEIDPQLANHKGELWQTAIRVYQRMPSLHRSETGQAEALAIASEYFLERQSNKNGLERTSELSKKVANLKRKTALDVKTRSANADSVSSKKLKDAALKGSYNDKLAYISKTLVPDEFLQVQ